MHESTQESETSSDISRRSLLVWGGALAAGAMANALPAVAQTPAGTIKTGVPVEMDARGVELYMKLHAAVSDVRVPWYYTGRIYAVREGQAPVHLFNLEGTEIYWVKKIGEAKYTTLSSTLTFYRDIKTGEYFDSYKNPFTDKTLSVRPNVLRGANGVTFSTAGFESGTKKTPWVVETHENGGDVWLVTSRYSLTAPQPWIEIQTIFGKTAELVDPKNPVPPASFSSAYLAPWLKWMEMDQIKGHLLWHSSGRKLQSIDQIPKSYMDRAKQWAPGHFDAPA